MGASGDGCAWKERKLAVHRPRLRRPGRGAGKEVPLPAYEAMQEGEGLGARMLDILLRGVSTRQYQRVLPEMADTVGVSRSTVSRETMEAAAAELERLLNRRFEEVELLILYIDGMVFGDHHVIAAVGRGCGRAQARAGDSAGGYGETPRPSRTCWKV